jgi:hypothetical protein
VLLPLKHAAVFLNVEPESAEKLKNVIKSAIYKGPFAEIYGEPRYWTHLLTECKLPIQLPKAICKASGRDANVICDKCGDPFNSFFTVGVKRLNAVSLVENGRICGFCLQGDIEGFIIRQESLPIVENVIAETNALRKKQNDSKR